jgi:hypothetical protein
MNGLLRWFRPDGRLSAADAVDATWAFVDGGLSPVAGKRAKRRPGGRTPFPGKAS